MINLLLANLIGQFKPVIVQARIVHFFSLGLIVSTASVSWGQIVSAVFVSQDKKTVHTNSQFVYVIAWLGVKFGINFMSVVVRMAKIARGETQVKFIPKFHS